MNRLNEMQVLFGLLTQAKALVEYVQEHGEWIGDAENEATHRCIVALSHARDLASGNIREIQEALKIGR